MEIIIGKTAGFCYGVQNAVNKAEEQTHKIKNIYCLGELVHNKQVIEELSKKGINFVNDIEEVKYNLIIRAHGATKETYEIAKQKNLNIIDLTCPKVLTIHKTIQDYIKKDYYIFLIGQKEHPETIATKSFCGQYYNVIEDENDIEKAINDFNQSSKNKIFIASQTTYSMEMLNYITQKIKEKINKDIIEVKNTICTATKNRQEETSEIAQKVDVMIIIGGKHSSNTNKLYEIAKKYCEKVELVETKEELDISMINNKNKIGIMAGASTPQNSINEIVDILRKI